MSRPVNWRRLFDVIMRRPSPPHDERSIRAEQLDELEADARDTLRRVERLVPRTGRLDSYRRVRIGR